MKFIFLHNIATDCFIHFVYDNNDSSRSFTIFWYFISNAKQAAMFNLNLNNLAW